MEESSFGEGNFSYSNNVTIGILENNGETTKIDYTASCTVITPPTYYLTLTAANFDKSEARFQSNKDGWSVHSVLTLKDRTTVNVAGDRAELMRVQAGGRQGGSAETSKSTEFPLGYATWLFIPAGASPNDVISTFGASGSSIMNASFTLGSTEVLSTPFGSLETVTYKGATQTTAPQGTWRGDFAYYYSRSTGIMLQYRSSSRLIRTETTPGEESSETSFRLVGIDKAPSRLSIDSMPNEVNVNSQVRVSGRMYPGVGTTALDVMAKPDVGTEISTRVMTLQDGTFTATLTPATAGGWTLRISYAGDLTTKPSTAEKRFQVIGAQTATTSSTTETKTPAPDFSLVTISVIIASAALIGLVALRKGRKKPAQGESQSMTTVPTETEQKPETKFCIHCGAPLSESARFCASCGKSQE